MIGHDQRLLIPQRLRDAITLAHVENDSTELVVETEICYGGRGSANAFPIGLPSGEKPMPRYEQNWVKWRAPSSPL